MNGGGRETVSRSTGVQWYRGTVVQGYSAVVHLRWELLNDFILFSMSMWNEVVSHSFMTVES